jgi:eukaryotic-like serine/threonine-protein kinase
MTPETWQRVKTIFAAAHERPPEERARFLDEACGADAEVRAEVESLLRTEVAEFLDTGALPGQAQLRAALADRYRIARELGHGGMAAVWLAEDLKHHRPVALKVLRPDLAAVLGPNRFLREIEVTARLNHPHILPLLDSGEAAGFVYYAMPYVEGESLRDRLSREKQLPLDDALQIAREVADGLSYAHSHGVIHRDIKPENILLESGHAVVADFGIARAIDQAAGEKLTETGVTLGTPAYMSPEQAAGSRDLDGRSDLYSLGCVLYEALAGRPPFVGPTRESVVHQHLTNEPPTITSLRPAVPGWVAAALGRALAKTPADRFNPVALFGEAIMPRTSTSVTAEPPAQATLRAGRSSWRNRALIGVGAVVVIAGAIALGRMLRTSPAGARHPRTAIAVLPFQNLSADTSHAYFAGGLHEELLTQLAKVAALQVIGRTSVMEYAAQPKPPKEIADELNVGSIVEGSVQVVGERLVVHVQLIDAATGKELWGERYDRTLDDAFAVQSDIAQRIVVAVGATLGETERTAIAEAPTANPEAYRLYLQGLEYFRRPGNLRRNWPIAQDFYERALSLDSTFALAYASLSEVHGLMSWYRFDPTPERLVEQRQTAEAAVRLAPDLPQTHVAMGMVHYFGGRDWEGALKEYRLALEDLPNDAELWSWVGYVERRLGNWDQVMAAVDKVVTLDPRNVATLYDLGAGTMLFLRRYREAVEWDSRSLALAPDLSEADVIRGWSWVVWQGRLDSLKDALDRHLADAESWEWEMRSLLLYWERKPDSLLALLRRTPHSVIDDQTEYLPAALYAAWAHQLRGDGAAARVAFDSARAMLDSVVAVLPDDWRVHAARGLALAGLGRRQEAQREARWLQQSKVYREDAFLRGSLAEERARILAGIGEADAALQEIERLLAGPSWVSAHTLRLDPRWDPIRKDPRFQALLVKYANPQPVR